MHACGNYSHNLCEKTFFKKKIIEQWRRPKNELNRRTKSPDQIFLSGTKNYYFFFGPTQKKLKFGRFLRLITKFWS